MDTMQLIADFREARNKGMVRKLRRSGRIPAILYGEGEPKPISVDAKDWLMRFRNVSSNTIVDLKVGADQHKVLIKETQEDILNDRVNHIDFYAIQAGKKLQTRIPIHLEGTPHGVREGGILEHKIESLDVVCLPKDLPSSFTVDISHLGIGDSLHVGEISIPDGVEVRMDENLTVIVVSQPKEEVLEEEGAELDEGVEADEDVEES